jgi:hypothetical protein
MIRMKRAEMLEYLGGIISQHQSQLNQIEQELKSMGAAEPSTKAQLTTLKRHLELGLRFNSFLGDLVAEGRHELCKFMDDAPQPEPQELVEIPQHLFHKPADPTPEAVFATDDQRLFAAAKEFASIFKTLQDSVQENSADAVLRVTYALPDDVTIRLGSLVATNRESTPLDATNFLLMMRSIIYLWLNPS